MDPNVGRIPNEPTTPALPSRPVSRRRREKGGSFGEELAREEGEEEPDEHDEGRPRRAPDTADLSQVPSPEDADPGDADPEDADPGDADPGDADPERPLPEDSDRSSSAPPDDVGGRLDLTA